MKLSIIIPVYNAEKYLRECLDSVLSQTVEDYELILINDGSTDASQAIIDEYVASVSQRIITRTVDNGGQGRARNIGIELAKGDYLGFVDSDDWIEPGMYEKLISAAERENADVVVCNILNRYSDGREEYPKLWDDRRPQAAAGSACNKLFRRDTVGNVRFPEGLWYEDFAFSAKIICGAKKIVHVAEPLYIYRIGHESTMNNENARKNLDIIPVMDSLEAFLESCGRREDFEYFVINHVLLDSINRLAAQNCSERKPVIKRLRAYVKEKLPKLRACRSFKAQPLKRRLIMRLNYLGLETLSQLILRAKKIIK